MQSSRKSGQVELPRMPSLCSSGPTVSPGVAALDQEAGELLAVDLGETVNRSAKPALVMYCLVPVSFQVLPSADSTALVLAASASEPEPGSVRA